MIKQVGILSLCFIITLILNSLFQTLCQNIFSTIVNGSRVCRITQPIDTSIYWILILIITLALYAGYLKTLEIRKSAKSETK